MPRLIAIGFAPAATVLHPSLKIDCAKTVAVVVPVTGHIEVLEATSRHLSAHVFQGILQFDLLATVRRPCNQRRAEFLVQTTLRPWT